MVPGFRYHVVTVVAMLTLLMGSSFNSGMRDAQIGLSLLLIALLCLRLVQERGSPWQAVLPPRLSGLLRSDDPKAGGTLL